MEFFSVASTILEFELVRMRNRNIYYRRMLEFKDVEEGGATAYFE